MRKDHPLGPACAARGVEDRRHVHVDDAVLSGRVAGRQQRVPAGSLGAVRQVSLQRHVADENQVAQVRTVAEHFGKGGCSLRGGDQCPNIAVAEDVLDLRWLQDRVDWYEHATGPRCAEHRDYGFELLGQEDSHAVVALEAEGNDGGREGVESGAQFAVGQRGRLVPQRHRVARSLGADQRQLVKQTSHGQYLVSRIIRLVLQGFECRYVRQGSVAGRVRPGPGGHACGRRPCGARYC